MTPATLALRVECRGTPHDDTLATLEALAGKNPGALDLRFAYACMLEDFGRLGPARDAYDALLAAAPQHFGALTNRGTMAFVDGDTSTAFAFYLRAARHHPHEAAAFANLGTVLTETGDVAAAQVAYERACAIDPAFAPARLALARFASAAGDAPATAAHRAAAFATPIVQLQPFRGRGTPLRIVLLLAADGGNLVKTLLFDDRCVALTSLVVESWNGAPLPPHDAIVNGIADADRSGAALACANALLVANGVTAINPPDAVLRTGRVDVARRLRDLDGVITPRLERVARAGLSDAALAARGWTFPFLVRAAGYHSGRHFERIDAADGLARARAALPGDDFFIIEPLATRSADGYHRKYRVLFVGGVLCPLHVAISPHWKVHYFSAAMDRHDAHRAEEARFLHDMPAHIGARACDALGRIRDALGLDYGGIDFGLDDAGRVLLFEANASMAVYVPGGDAFAYRRPAAERVLASFGALLSARASRGRGAETVPGC
jgi:tetratricopeptide (TPR) repeat protein